MSDGEVRFSHDEPLSTWSRGKHARGPTWYWRPNIDVGRELRRAVFLDRDGVINRMWIDPDHGLIDSPSNPDQFTMLPGVPEAVTALRAMGFLIVVASNQPGIAKGKLRRDLLEAVTDRMLIELGSRQPSIDAIYYCLHHPDAALDDLRFECMCRKPRPGLLTQAAQDLGIDLSRSYMIGDGITDVEAGQAAGCRTIWIGSWKCDVCQATLGKGAVPDFVARDLTAAVEIVRSRVAQS